MPRGLWLIVELRFLERRQNINARDVAIQVDGIGNIGARWQSVVHDGAIALIVNDPARGEPDSLAAEIYERKRILLLANGRLFDAVGQCA